MHLLMRHPSISQLEGKLDLALPGIGRPASTDFFNLKQNIWRGDNSSSAPRKCPSHLFFEMKLPSTYRGRSLKEVSLPPSCEISLPECKVGCIYTLTISASKSPRLAIMKRKKRFVDSTLSPTQRLKLNMLLSFTVVVDYHPESLPPRPVIPLDVSFSETETSIPAAWHETKSVVKTRYSSGIEPIQCHVSSLLPIGCNHLSFAFSFIFHRPAYLAFLTLFHSMYDFRDLSRLSVNCTRMAQPQMRVEPLDLSSACG